MAFIAVGLLLFCQLYFGNPIGEETTFYQNTSVNGIDISGLNKQQATQLVDTTLANEMANTTIVLTDGEHSWQLCGKDFEYVGNIENPLSELLNYGREGNFFEKKKIEKQIKQQGLKVEIPYENLFGGMKEKVNEICQEVEKTYHECQIKFDPNKAQMFTLSKGQTGKVVDREKLSSALDKAISSKNSREIEIPLAEIVPENNGEELLKQIGKRSQFATSYATSSTKRKNNIKKALECFNGMTVLPGETVSFNQTTGPRTKENGYENANIIIDGNYVPGTGGGVCQASTTLYNALVLADIEILQMKGKVLKLSVVGKSGLNIKRLILCVIILSGVMAIQLYLYCNFFQDIYAKLEESENSMTNFQWLLEHIVYLIPVASVALFQMIAYSGDDMGGDIILPQYVDVAYFEADDTWYVVDDNGEPVSPVLVDIANWTPFSDNPLTQWISSGRFNFSANGYYGDGEQAGDGFEGSYMTLPEDDRVDYTATMQAAAANVNEQGYILATGDVVHILKLLMQLEDQFVDNAWTRVCYYMRPTV